jgi:hypothetical protein
MSALGLTQRADEAGLLRDGSRVSAANGRSDASRWAASMTPLEVRHQSSAVRQKSIMGFLLSAPHFIDERGGGSMKPLKSRTSIAAAATTALLTLGCGGGGGGSPPGGGTGVIAPIPSPAPAPAPGPTPTPTPPPLPVAAPFPPSNLSASQTFPALGYSIYYEYNGLNIDSSRPVNLNEPLVVRYNGETRSYETKLPGFGPGRLVLNATTGGRGYSLTNGVASDTLQGVFVNFFAGQISSNQSLTDSNFAVWDATISGPFSVATAIGYFAFGLPTPAGVIPSAGTRAHTFLGRGFTEVFSTSASRDFRYLSVTGSLQFDFTGRRSTGSLQLASDELGREQDFGTFTLNGEAVQPDGSFTGAIVMPGSAEQGQFEGRFAGPDASEIIVRWRMPLPVVSASRPVQAFGVWVGKGN